MIVPLVFGCFLLCLTILKLFLLFRRVDLEADYWEREAGAALANASQWERQFYAAENESRDLKEALKRSVGERAELSRGLALTNDKLDRKRLEAQDLAADIHKVRVDLHLAKEKIEEYAADRQKRGDALAEAGGKLAWYRHLFDRLQGHFPAVGSALTGRRFKLTEVKPKVKRAEAARS